MNRFSPGHIEELQFTEEAKGSNKYSGTIQVVLTQ